MFLFFESGKVDEDTGNFVLYRHSMQIFPNYQWHKVMGLYSRIFKREI